MKTDGRVHGRGRGSGRWGLALAAVVAVTGCSSGGGGGSRPAPGVSRDERYLRARELNQKGLEAQQAGRADEAIGLYREAVRVEPKMFQAWNNLGVLYMEKQNYVEAGLALKSAADLEPSDPVPMENLGLTYARAGHANKALEYYLEAIGRAPNHAEAYRGAYRASEQLGLKDAAALERVEKALLVEPDAKWRAIYMRKRVWLSNEPGNESAGK